MVRKEFSAKTIEEAVTKALIEFGTTSAHIGYEVIEKGSTGLLGFIGSRPAVIRAWVKEEKKVEPVVKPEEPAVSVKTAPEPAPVKEAVSEPAAEPEIADEAKNEPAASDAAPTEEKTVYLPVSDEYKTFLADIFRVMNLEVRIESKFDAENGTLDVNLIGNDMGILIGKRGQTLDSLQYLVSLVVNKKRDSYVRVKLDTENYRERRKETLETLAKNISNKVKRTKRPVSLEPMNPYERRVIHAALQNDKYVLTRSEGEEPYRHVVVFLKRERYHKS